MGASGLIREKHKSLGRPSKLNNRELMKLKKVLSKSQLFSTAYVKLAIKHLFNKSVSLPTARKISKGLGYVNSKPYTLNQKRPADAEDILNSRLSDVTNEVMQECIASNVEANEETVVFGFVDECSAEKTNKSVWHKAGETIKISGQFCRVNTIGLYTQRVCFIPHKH